MFQKQYIFIGKMFQKQSEKEFAIPNAWVVSGSGNVERTCDIIYLPIYFLMFLKRNSFEKPLIYKVE